MPTDATNTAGTAVDGSVTPTIPVEPRAVASGSASDVDKALADSMDAYKGLQRRLNVVNQEALTKSQEADRFAEQNAALQAQIDQLNAKLGEAEQVRTAKATVDAQLGSVKADADMWRMISTEFSSLGPVVTQMELKPKESVEATRAMLTALNSTIMGAVQQETQKRVGNYSPESGSLGRQEPLTETALRKKMAETAGTKEYEGFATQYFAKIQASGDYPKPKARPYDDIVR